MAHMTVSTDEEGRIVEMVSLADARSYVPTGAITDSDSSTDRHATEQGEHPGNVTVTVVVTLTDFSVPVDVPMLSEMRSMHEFPSPVTRWLRLAPDWPGVS